MSITQNNMHKNDVKGLISVHKSQEIQSYWRAENLGLTFPSYQQPLCWGRKEKQRNRELHRYSN